MARNFGQVSKKVPHVQMVLAREINGSWWPVSSDSTRRQAGARIHWVQLFEFRDRCNRRVRELLDTAAFAAAIVPSNANSTTNPS